MTNPHQVDEKMFQDLFLFFIRHLFGFRPHHKRPKEHFLERSTDNRSNRYDTSCNTNVEQRNVASALHRPLRQRFHSLKGALRAMFCNSCNFCETNANCAETSYWCNSAFGSIKVEVARATHYVSQLQDESNLDTAFIGIDLRQGFSQC